MTQKIECHTPTPGKKPVNIEKWKYDKVSKAILEIVPKSGDGVLFKELPDKVLKKIGKSEMLKIGSSSWYTTTIKLDLEYKKQIYRVNTSSPQRLLKRV